VGGWLATASEDSVRMNERSGGTVTSLLPGLAAEVVPEGAAVVMETETGFEGPEGKSGGAETGTEADCETGGSETGGCETGGSEMGGCETGGSETGGCETGGSLMTGPEADCD
jgi:hypothetical protein